MAKKSKPDLSCIVHPSDDVEWLEAALKAGKFIKLKDLWIKTRPVELPVEGEWELSRCEIFTKIVPWCVLSDPYVAFAKVQERFWKVHVHVLGSNENWWINGD